MELSDANKIIISKYFTYESRRGLDDGQSLRNLFIAAFPHKSVPLWVRNFLDKHEVKFMAMFKEPWCASDVDPLLPPSVTPTTSTISTTSTSSTSSTSSATNQISTSSSNSTTSSSSPTPSVSATNSKSKSSKTQTSKQEMDANELKFGSRAGAQWTDSEFEKLTDFILTAPDRGSTLLDKIRDQYTDIDNYKELEELMGEAGLFRTRKQIASKQRVIAHANVSGAGGNHHKYEEIMKNIFPNDVILTGKIATVSSGVSSTALFAEVRGSVTSKSSKNNSKNEGNEASASTPSTGEILQQKIRDSKKRRKSEGSKADDDDSDTNLGTPVSSARSRAFQQMNDDFNSKLDKVLSTPKPSEENLGQFLEVGMVRMAQIMQQGRESQMNMFMEWETKKMQMEQEEEKRRRQEQKEWELQKLLMQRKYEDDRERSRRLDDEEREQRRRLDKEEREQRRRLDDEERERRRRLEDEEREKRRNERANF